MGDEYTIRFRPADEPRGTDEQELAFLNHALQAVTSTLDLNIAKEIIDRHGGRLTIDGQIERGATFIIWLRPV